MKKIVCLAICMVGSFFLGGVAMDTGTIIILNGPSGSGKSSIQKEFQKLMMPNLWLKLGIDNLFDMPMPDITPENMQYWQTENPIRWVEQSQDAEGNNVITLCVGPQAENVAYAMNSAIAAYAQNGCNVIVDYIAYDQKWLIDLEKKSAPFKTYYVAVEIPLETLEEREAARATSPQGHARSHYATVYGDKKYDLVVNSKKNSAQEIAEQIKQMVGK
jgi:chloramphenicol 3-O phosphotransferase